MTDNRAKRAKARQLRADHAAGPRRRPPHDSCMCVSYLTASSGCQGVKAKPSVYLWARPAMSLGRRKASRRAGRAVPAASSSNRADVVTMPVRPPGSEPPPDVEPRWTAIDPNLLTVEIGLLLDYISGVPGHSLASGSRGRLPSGCSAYEEALTRYFAIDERMRRREPATPADVQFLLELRDYLNGQAEPATGATIAFSTLVIRNTPDDTKAKADVARAYPEWIPLAQALRRTMLRLQVGSLIITVAIAVIAAYAYVGNRM